MACTVMHAHTAHAVASTLPTYQCYPAPASKLQSQAGSTLNGVPEMRVWLHLSQIKSLQMSCGCSISVVPGTSAHSVSIVEGENSTMPPCRQFGQGPAHVALGKVAFVAFIRAGFLGSQLGPNGAPKGDYTECKAASCITL